MTKKSRSETPSGFFRPLRSMKGFLLVGEVVGSGLMILAIAAVVAMTKFGFDSFHKVRVEGFLIERETNLISVLQSAEVLEDLDDSMAGGQVPDGYEFKMLVGTSSGTVNRLIAVHKTPLWVNFKHEKCDTPGQNECLFRIELDVRCTRVHATNECFAAYRIRAHDSGFILGTHHLETFKPSDYTTPLPFEVRGKMVESACDPARHIFMSGLNKYTGKVNCVRRPRNPCGPNQIALGYQIPDDPAQPPLMICRDLYTLKCPKYYAMMTVNPFSLHPDSPAPIGKCVFAGLPKVPFKNPPAPAEEVTGDFCPAPYSTVATCGLVDIVAKSGLCPSTCCSGDSCTPCLEMMAPIPGSSSFSVTGQTATCKVVYAAQPCAAVTWKAKAKLTGDCQSHLPEVIPARKGGGI